MIIISIIIIDIIINVIKQKSLITSPNNRETTSGFIEIKSFAVSFMLAKGIHMKIQYILMIYI